MPRTAWITLRHQPPYRSDAFADGFESLGFRVRLAFPRGGEVKADDVVVVWNLNPRYRPAAWEAKKAGAPLLVAENGYVSKHRDLTHYYALARDGHNGSGYWFIGSEDRWADLGRTLQPWVDRPHGDILIVGQRGIGSDIMRCPKNFWEMTEPRVQALLAKAKLKRPPAVRFRPHPGRHAPDRPLADDLARSRAVVAWGSNVVNEALLAGVPAFRLAPYHVNDAAVHDLSRLLDPPARDRLAAFRKVAWAQWSLDEIQSGMAFRTLLQDVL